MTVRKVVMHTHDVLSEMCTPVADITDELRAILDDMLETMYDAPGIGLAAPQIGINQRFLVMNVDRDDREDSKNEGTAFKLINPEVIWESEEVNTYDEGCLSLPGIAGDVERPAAVKVKYLDERGDEQVLEADGLLATCVQHEIDHLNGVLFIDHLSRLRRSSLLRKYKKILQSLNQDADHAL